MATVSNMILNNNKSKPTSFGAHPDPPLWGYHSSMCQQQKDKSRKKLNLNQTKDRGPKMVFLREKTPPEHLLRALWGWERDTGEEGWGGMNCLLCSRQQSRTAKPLSAQRAGTVHPHCSTLHTFQRCFRSKVSSSKLQEGCPP